MVQAFETSQFIRHTRHGADVCILGGDLNTECGDLPYRIIRFNTSLQDTFIDTGKVGSIFFMFSIKKSINSIM